MRKYVVFHIEAFYPQGGLGDVVGSFDSLDEAKAFPFQVRFCEGIYDQTVQIVDRDSWEIVWTWSGAEELDSSR